MPSAAGATAVTWARIADIAYRRGDYDQAAELQRKRLEAHKQLGDLEGIAAASWDLAQIDLARQDYQAAVPRLTEAFEILGQLERPDEIAVVGLALGQLLISTAQTGAGQPRLARAVRSSATAWRPPPRSAGRTRSSRSTRS